MKLTNILFLTLLTSCGFDLKIKGIDGTDVNLGPNFKEIAEFCDERYGASTIDAEKCFEDYREFFKPKVTLDLDVIKTFCEENSTNEAEVDQCIDDILDLFAANSNS